MGSAIPRVEESGRTLIIGSTRFIGRFVAEASSTFSWPTYLMGSSNDKATMEKILKEHKIETVISAVGGESILKQFALVEAIKSVGTIKRFVPSEFGHNIDRADPMEPGLAMYEKNRKVRRLIEGSSVPYTYICCNLIAAWPYHDNTHPADVLPPLDHFHIYGDGTVKAFFVAGSDIGKFTMKCLDNDQTLNKTVHFRPSTNVLSINELVSLWEEKIGLKLPRVTVTEDDLLSAAQVTSLYPDMAFKTVDECFGDFAKKIADVPKAIEDSG
ncbi:hypothetical protein NL676_003457 [Syzygium grande]|nr:hypothetical protein NL676_003457 [Syzygium grande]